MQLSATLNFFAAFLFLQLTAIAGYDPFVINFQNHSFIENKGQFNNRVPAELGEILYAVDYGSTQILFTKMGVIYSIYETRKNYDRRKGDKNAPRMIVKSENIKINWLNPNDNSQITAYEMTGDRSTYVVKTGPKQFKDITNIRGYKKLVYHNLYKGIDLIYEFHPKGGLKYSFKVQAGADVNQIQFQVNSQKTSIDDAGNLQIPTYFGNITDFAPESFYESNRNKKIETKFTINENVVGFQLSNYKADKPIIIDPWTVTPNNFSNSNLIFEIETDQNNNIYVYGGDSPMRLRKYNSAGALQWTYNTPWDTSSYWVGTLKTDLAGNSYITSGTSGTLRKINTGGTMDWTNANNGPIPEIEFWSLAFNCDYTKLYCGGMRSDNGLTVNLYRGTLFDMNLTTGGIISYQNVGFNTGGFIPTIKEVRSITYSPNGKIYYLTLDSLGCMNSNFTQQYQTSSGFNFTYGIPDYGVTNQGVHAIAANTDFIFTNNGNTLQKRSIVNGAVLQSVAIPGGISNAVPIVGGNTPGNSGIVLDSCGNIYVGSGNAIHKFNQDLTLLGTANTPAAVYDVAVNYNNEVVACGNNFIISISTFNNCSPANPVCLNCLELTPAGPFCTNDGPVTLTANNPGGVWSGTGITNTSTGVFNPNIAGVGTHIIHYTLNPALSCGVDSLVIVVNNCTAPTVCLEQNGNISISGANPPFTWQSQTTIQDCSACILLCIFPPGCAVNVTAWQTFATGTSITPPGTFPIQVIDNVGNTIVIDSLAQLPICVNCPPISVTATLLNNVSCNGLSNGAGSATASGGTLPYSYVWNPGNLSGANQNALPAGNYTITAFDSAGCTGTTTLQITQPNVLDITITQTTPSLCTSPTGTANTSTTGGTPAYTYTWSSIPVQNTANATALSAGNYSVFVVDQNGCADTAFVTIVNPNPPIITFVSQTNVNCFGDSTGTATISASAGTPPYTYNWSPTGGTQATGTNLPAGTSVVTVTDAGGCQASFNVNISQNPEIIINTSSTPANCGLADGTASANASGGFAPYQYSWSPQGGNGNQATGLNHGTFTVTVTDSLGCIKSANVQVPVLVTDSTLSATVQTNPATCAGNDGSATITPAGGLAPYTYTWPVGINSDSAFAAGFAVGTYVMNLGDQCYSIPVSFEITESNASPKVNLPNIFTPNGDGLNDIYNVGNQFDATLEFNCVIYNRWGSEVHKTTDKAINWEGKKSSEGVYFIVVEFTDCQGKKDKATGTITVSRN